MVVIAERLWRGEQPDLRHGAQLGQRRGEPLPRRVIAELAAPRGNKPPPSSASRHQHDAGASAAAASAAARPAGPPPTTSTSQWAPLLVVVGIGLCRRAPMPAAWRMKCS